MARQASRILSCSVSECAYNRNNACHTLAITVGDAMHAACDTFYKAKTKGGAADLTGSVGACKMESCNFNRDFECSAEGIKVGPHSGHADCQTFKAK